MELLPYRIMHHLFLINPKQKPATVWVFGYFGHISHNFSTCLMLALILSMFDALCICSLKLWRAWPPSGRWFLLFITVDGKGFGEIEEVKIQMH